MVPAGVWADVGPVVVEGEGGTARNVHVGVQVAIPRNHILYMQSICYIV
jgi:hypothetical protein